MLGVVALAGGFVCYLPILAAPFAWVIGHRSVRRIDASDGRLGGRGLAMTGWITGVIGSVLLLIAIVLGVVLLVIGLNGGFETDPRPYDDGGDLGASLRTTWELLRVR